MVGCRGGHPDGSFAFVGSRVGPVSVEGPEASISGVTPAGEIVEPGVWCRSVVSCAFVFMPVGLACAASLLRAVVLGVFLHGTFQRHPFAKPVIITFGVGDQWERALGSMPEMRPVPAMSSRNGSVFRAAFFEKAEKRCSGAPSLATALAEIAGRTARHDTITCNPAPSSCEKDGE